MSKDYERTYCVERGRDTGQPRLYRYSPEICHRCWRQAGAVRRGLPKGSPSQSSDRLCPALVVGDRALDPSLARWHTRESKVLDW